MANYRLRIGHNVGYQLPADAGGYALSGQTTGLTYTPAAGAEPYTWFPSFDKQLFPPHLGSGVWGPQSTVKEAAPPNGPFTDVTANSAAQLATHIYTPGRRITLTGNIAAASFNAGPIADVDIIVPPGILWNSPVLGGSNTVTRLRIRGNTVGTHSGGQVHQLWLFGTGSDLIIDGIDSSGTSNFFAMNLGPAAGFNRVAVTNVRMNCGGFGIGSTAADLTVTNTSILTGNDLAFSEDEAYGIRSYFETNGNVIVYGCDIRSNPNRTVSSHARYRCHPDAGLDYVWIYGNKFVERVENWIFWVDAAAGGGSGDARCVWVDNNQIISSGTGTAGSAGTPKLFGGDTNVAFARNNAFNSTGFTSDSSIVLTGITQTTKSGNTYAGLISDFAWGGPGDPSSIDWTP